MEVALLNVHIKFQNYIDVEDELGSHTTEWVDYFSCYATVGGENGSEKAIAGLVVDDADLSFTVRYCKKVSVINILEYRIVFHKELYNITSIDHMNYKKKCFKFRCKKVRH